MNILDLPQDALRYIMRILLLHYHRTLDIMADIKRRLLGISGDEDLQYVNWICIGVIRRMSGLALVCRRFRSAYLDMMFMRPDAYCSIPSLIRYQSMQHYVSIAHKCAVKLARKRTIGLPRLI